MWNDGDSETDAETDPETDPETDTERPAVAARPSTPDRQSQRAARDRSAEPVLPDGDPELADDGWGGSRDADAARDDDLIADRPPHYDR